MKTKFNEGLNPKNVKLISVDEWDDLVSKTYGRPYSFQQQKSSEALMDGCKPSDTFSLNIPSNNTDDNMMNDSIPEVVNGQKIGVKFKVWLERDPKKPLSDEPSDWELELFWERSFYPDIHTIANDLYEKGLVESGEYVIDIDW